MSNRRINPPRQEKGSKIGSPSEKIQIPPEQQAPIFCLRYLEGNYCLTKCQQDERAAFADKIHRLSKLTWSEIQSQGRHKLGCEKISRDAIKASIPSHITKEVNFLSFRFCGMKAMVGYRDGSVFHVIWLDRDFTLYNHS